MSIENDSQDEDTDSTPSLSADGLKNFLDGIPGNAEIQLETNDGEEKCIGAEFTDGADDPIVKLGGPETTIGEPPEDLSEFGDTQ